MFDLDFCNATVQTKRLTVVEEAYEPTNKRIFAVHLSSLKCHIQPFDDNISQDITVGFGKDWLLFCNVVDIKEGDRVIWDEKEYRVVAVEKFTELDLAHMEVKIRAFES